ncbi:MAG: DUF4328 domain-containing protein [Candidatus Dormiibacterota bacterium]
MQPAGQLSQDGRWLWNGRQWVPYQQPLNAAVAWARPYESAQPRARLATVFIAIDIGILIPVTALNLMPSTATDNPLVAVLFVLVALVVIASYPAAVVFYCMWLHRVVRNMPALGSLDPRWKPSGAVWRCFIPFLNLAHPLLSVLDAWRGSERSTHWLDVAARRSIPVPAAIVWWWIFWLFSDVSNIRVNGSTPTAFDVLATVTTIVAGLLAIKIIRDLTGRQDRKNDLIASGQLA